MQTPFQTLLLEFGSSIVRSQREDGSSYLHLSEKPAPWASDALYAMHEGELPNDTRYLWARVICDSLITCETAEDAREALDSVAESVSTVSTAELLSFYQENLSRLSLPDEYQEEHGSDPEARVSDRLHLGLWLAARRTGEALISAVSEELDR